jgi:hypothetical protein
MIRFGTPNRHTIDLRKVVADALVMLTTGVASGHLVNLLMATYRYWYPPMALGKGPKIYNPHTAKGQEVGIICSACAGVCICFAWNWHALQDLTSSAASWSTVGQ